MSLPNNDPTSRTEHAGKYFHIGKAVPALTLSVAVLDESKNIVYILFGYQDTKALVNTFDTVLAVNVTDLAHLNFVVTDQDLSTEAETPTAAIGDTETVSPAPDSSNSNKSAAIGGAVGGSLGVSCYAYCCKKLELTFFFMCVGSVSHWCHCLLYLEKQASRQKS